LIAVSNLRIRLDELLLLVSFFFRSLFSITVAYPLFQIETSLIAICFELAGLQLFIIIVASILPYYHTHRYVSHFLCSFLFCNFKWSKTWTLLWILLRRRCILLFYYRGKNVMRKLLTCYSILLWILFHCSFVLLLLLLLQIS